jgi:maltose alpha-D-glucosyltransferase / alpha-amylase
VTAEKNLLQLFLLEKAGYEIAYEAANRPSWIDVPLHGMAQLVTHLVGEQVPS